MEATPVKNDEFTLCYDLKRDSVKKIEELQKIINKLTDILKSQIKAKRDLRNALCDKCRGIPYGVLNLPVLSFAQVGCQTDGQLSDLDLSQISNTETYDAKNGSAKQNISVPSLPMREQGREEQDTVQIRTETTLSEQMKRLITEKKQLQGSLKSKQEIIQKHEAALESENEEHQTALTKLKAAVSKKIERLTLENEELKNNMKTQQETVQKLQTMLEENRSELDKIKEENKMYVVKISQLETEKQTLQDQTNTLNKTNKEMVSNMEDQHQEMENLKRKLDEKDEKSLLEDCRRLKKKEVVMRVLRASRSGVGKRMMETVTDVLARQLRGRLDSRHFDFTIDLPDTLADVSKGPLFLVCLNSTVVKNVPDALEGPKGGRDVYLLVLHQITTENLSTLRPDSLRNTGSELRQLGGVIDMVFSSESGFSSESCLWECDINSTAVEKIVTVLKKI